jgi:hypothetical protein
MAGTWKFLSTEISIGIETRSVTWHTSKTSTKSPPGFPYRRREELSPKRLYGLSAVDVTSTGLVLVWCVAADCPDEMHIGQSDSGRRGRPSCACRAQLLSALAETPSRKSRHVSCFVRAFESQGLFPIRWGSNSAHLLCSVLKARRDGDRAERKSESRVRLRG